MNVINDKSFDICNYKVEIFQQPFSVIEEENFNRESWRGRILPTKVDNLDISEENFILFKCDESDTVVAINTKFITSITILNKIND